MVCAFLPSSKVDKVISELTDMRITTHAFSAGQTGKSQSTAFSTEVVRCSTFSGTVPTKGYHAKVSVFDKWELYVT